MVKFTFVKYYALCKRFELAYTKKTTSKPALWNEFEPYIGHDDLVAISIYNQLGGKILKTRRNGEDFYFNELEEDIVFGTGEKFEIDSSVIEEVDVNSLLRDRDIRTRLREFDLKVRG